MRELDGRGVYEHEKWTQERNLKFIEHRVWIIMNVQNHCFTLETGSQIPYSGILYVFLY